MLERFRELFSGGVRGYSPVFLFEVKNLLEGEKGFDVPFIEGGGKNDGESGGRVVLSGEEEFILGVLRNSGWVRSSDLLRACLDNGVCSRATFFRRLNKLVEQGLVVKRVEGKERFYSVA